VNKEEKYPELSLENARSYNLSPSLRSSLVVSRCRFHRRRRRRPSRVFLFGEKIGEKNWKNDLIKNTRFLSFDTL